GVDCRAEKSGDEGSRPSHLQPSPDWCPSLLATPNPKRPDARCDQRRRRDPSPVSSKIRQLVRSPRPWEQRGGLPGNRTSFDRERSYPHALPLQSTCCTTSFAVPCSDFEPLLPCIRCQTPRRLQCH